MRLDAWYAHAATYPLILAIQTTAAVVLLGSVFPLFQDIIIKAGHPQPLSVSTAVTALTAVAIMQACYWARYHRVPMRTALRGALAGHLMMFASRVSFFFGAALFSAIFFRHVPQLDALPPFGIGLVKTLGVLALMFALFCYALELERLGRLIEEQSRDGASAQDS